MHHAYACKTSTGPGKHVTRAGLQCVFCHIRPVRPFSGALCLNLGHFVKFSFVARSLKNFDVRGNSNFFLGKEKRIMQHFAYCFRATLSGRGCLDSIS